MLIDVHAGDLSHTNFVSFSAAMIVIGGSGITFGLSVIKDLVDKDLKGKSRVNVMNIEWDYNYYQPWSDNEWLVDEMLAILNEDIIMQ